MKGIHYEKAHIIKGITCASFIYGTRYTFICAIDTYQRCFKRQYPTYRRNDSSSQQLKQAQQTQCIRNVRWESIVKQKNIACKFCSDISYSYYCTGIYANQHPFQSKFGCSINFRLKIVVCTNFGFLFPTMLVNFYFFAFIQIFRIAKQV